MKKGGPSLNPSGKPKSVDRELDALRERVEEFERIEAAREVAEADRDVEGGQITAGRMRKVLGQDPSQDTGPTEQRLREWLSKDPKGYIGVADEKHRVERGDAELKVANDRLREENKHLKEIASPEPDEKDEEDGGSERARATLKELFERVKEESRVRNEQFVKDGLCVNCGQKPRPGQGEAGRIVKSQADEEARRSEWALTQGHNVGAARSQ